MTKHEWDKTVAWMMALFPQWNPDAATSAAWFEEMGSQVGVYEFKQALRDCMWEKPSPFPPGVFEIKAVLMRDQEAPSGEEMWDQVMFLCQRGQLAFPPNFPMEAQKAVRACGGMNTIAYTALEKLPFLRKEFLSCYKHETKKIGAPELEAREEFYFPDEVKTMAKALLGNMEKDRDLN